MWEEGKAACEAKHGWHSPLGRKLCQGAEPGAYLAPPPNFQSSSCSIVFGLLQSNFDNVPVVTSSLE